MKKKDPIVSSYQQRRSARRPIWRPISGKEKWKARGKMQRRPRHCLRQKTNKKDPILIFIWAYIGSLLYLCSHRLFSENTDVSTTELNRKPRLQFELPMDKTFFTRAANENFVRGAAETVTLLSGAGITIIKPVYRVRAGWQTLNANSTWLVLLRFRLLTLSNAQQSLLGFLGVSARKTGS